MSKTSDQVVVELRNIATIEDKFETKKGRGVQRGRTEETSEHRCNASDNV